MFQPQHPVGIKKARRTANVGHAFLKHAPIIYTIAQTCKKKFFTSYSQFQCVKFFEEKTCQASDAFDSAQVLIFPNIMKFEQKQTAILRKTAPSHNPQTPIIRALDTAMLRYKCKKLYIFESFSKFQMPHLRKNFFRPPREKSGFSTIILQKPTKHQKNWLLQQHTHT